MSWADIKNRYKSGGTAATQSTEDMAARRILRALGLSEKGLTAAEKASGLADRRQADTTLLERVQAVVSAVSGRGPLPPVRDVRSIGEAEEMALELAEQDRANCWLVYRVRGTDNLMAMRRVCDDLGTVVDLDLPMPCRLFVSRGGCSVMVSCDAQALYNKLMNQEARNG